MANNTNRQPPLMREKKEFYSLEQLIEWGLKPFPANERVPTPLPRAEVEAKIEAAIAESTMPGVTREVLCPVVKGSRIHSLDMNCHSWACAFDSILSEITNNKYVKFNMDDKDEKRLRRGDTIKGGPGCIAGEIDVWEVVRLLVANATSVGCILAHNWETRDIGDSGVLYSEVICLLRLTRRYLRERPRPPRMTVTIITTTRDEFRVVQGVMPDSRAPKNPAAGGTRPMAMRVTWRASLASISGKSAEARDKWLTAVGWVLFRGVSEEEQVEEMSKLQIA